MIFLCGTFPAQPQQTKRRHGQKKSDMTKDSQETFNESIRWALRGGKAPQARKLRTQDPVDQMARMNLK